MSSTYRTKDGDVMIAGQPALDRLSKLGLYIAKVSHQWTISVDFQLGAICTLVLGGNNPAMFEQFHDTPRPAAKEACA